MPSNLVTMHFTKNSSNQFQPDPPSWTKKMINYTYGPGVVVPTIQCTLNFSIPNDMKPPVLFYYRLTNFYQNHRRYAKSFDTDQLSGKAVSADLIGKSDCTPLRTVEINNVTKPYYPCGLAANSVFNDTFYSPVLLNVEAQDAFNRTYVMANNSGISWSSDKDLYGESKYNWDDVVVPPNWVERYPNGYSAEYHPHLADDEAFQVWMRLAGLPTFSKLAQRNDTATMITGSYTVDIDHRSSPLAPSPNTNPQTNSFLLSYHRFQRNRIRWHQIYRNIHTYRNGRKEPLPRHRIRSCRRHLHRSRRAIYRHASHPSAEAGGSYLFELEQQ